MPKNAGENLARRFFAGARASGALALVVNVSEVLFRFLQKKRRSIHK